MAKSKKKMEAKGTGYVWVDAFTTESLKSFYDEFVKLESTAEIDTIPIIISSYGGDVHSLIAARDVIKSSTKKVATIGLGKAMSCGALLLGAGTKGLRFATENTRIMLHQVASYNGYRKTSEVVADAEETEYLNNLFYELLAQDCGTTASKIRSLIESTGNSDRYLSADAAKRLGLIDKVGTPRIYEESPVKVVKL